MFAQTNAAQQPEVAAAVVEYACTVGSDCDTAHPGGITRDPIHYSCIYCMFEGLVMQGFSLQDTRQVQGVPESLRWARYDLQMTVSSPVDKATMMGLVRSVVVQAFGLKWHTTVKTFPALALVVAKGGPKFKYLGPIAPDEVLLVGVGRGGMQFQTIAQLISYINALPEQENRRIVDETGLAGRYQINLNLAGQVWVPSPVFAQVKEQLGLDFAPTKKKAEEEYVVIDSAQALRGKWVMQ